MRGKLSPGQRAQLAAMGIDSRARAFNRAALAGDVDLKNVAIPKSSDELAEMLADDGQLRKVSANRAQLHAFIDAYAAKTQPFDGDLQKQIELQVQTNMAEWLKANPNENLRRLNLDVRERPSDPQRRYAAGYNRSAPGAALDAEGLFDGPADYLKHVIGYKLNTLRGPQLDKMRHLLDAYSEAVPSDGGFLVPESMRTEMLQVALESSIVRSRARVIPMDTLKVTFPMIDSTSNVSSVLGGMIAYWTEEAAELTESQARFGKIALEAWKLTLLAKLSNELLNDSMMSFTAWYEQTAPQVIRHFEDLAFMRGTGAGEPLGFLNNPATVVVAKESSQTANTIVWQNVIKMYARMLPTSLNSAVWLVSPNTFPELATMALTVGTGGSAVWLTNGASGPPMTILGRPVIVSEKMSALGTQGDIAFVDLGYYLIGDRQTLSTMASEHAAFTRDQVVLRTIERVTGRPWLQSAITPQNNSDQLSPFVELAVRA